MPGIARVGDMTIGICDHGQDCCPHHCVGFHISGSEDVNVNNKGAIRAPGDFHVHNCPHCGGGFTVTGSSLSSINNKMIHRCGDVVTETCGTGTTVTCSEDGNVA